MSDRLTRKEIKHDIREDEVQSFLITAIDKFQERPGFYIGILVTFLAVGVGASGVSAYLDSRADKASEKLADAIKVYTAPVDADDPKPDDASPVFASEEERREKATAVLAEVDAGDAADIASLYEADMALEDGDAAKARSIWESFVDDHSDHALALSVRLNLLALDRQEGKAEDVAQRLQSELDRPEKTMPEDVLLYELARTRETLGQSEEAADLYQRIVDEYPRSSYASDARRRTAA